MGDSPITFTVQLTPQDLYRANLWLFMRRYWWVILVLAGPVLVSLLTILESSGQARKNLLENAAPLLIFYPGWLAWVFGRIYFGARSQFKQQKGLRQENRYTLSDEGIRIDADSSSERMDWSHIYTVRETKSFLFFHISKTTRLIIPKTALPNKETLRVLRQLIREHVKGKVRLLADMP